MRTGRSFNSSSKSNTSPSIFPSGQLGSLNPDALKLPILRHKSLTATYDHIAQLSAEADRLQQENRALQQRLDELTSNANVEQKESNPFSSFKRREMQFAQKIIERDNELASFARVINEYRVVKDPTFVEVAANANLKNQNPREKQKQNLDSITASLLVSNPQRPFFSRDDIEKQNEELRALISQQEETLRLLRARLSLFHQHDQENTLSFTINSLKKGQTPFLLADSTPSKRSELEIKKRILQKELHKLIKKRKEIAKERAAEKEKLRMLALKALENPQNQNKKNKKNKSNKNEKQEEQNPEQQKSQNQEQQDQNQEQQDQNQEQQDQNQEQQDQNQEQQDQNQEQQDQNQEQQDQNQDQQDQNQEQQDQNQEQQDQNQEQQDQNQEQQDQNQEQQDQNQDQQDQGPDANTEIVQEVSQEQQEQNQEQQEQIPDTNTEQAQEQNTESNTEQSPEEQSPDANNAEPPPEEASQEQQNADQQEEQNADANAEQPQEEASQEQNTEANTEQQQEQEQDPEENQG